MIVRLLRDCYPSLKVVPLLPISVCPSSMFAIFRRKLFDVLFSIISWLPFFRTLFQLFPSSFAFLNTSPSSAYISLSFIEAILSDPLKEKQIHHLISYDGSWKLSLQAREMNNNLHFSFWKISELCHPHPHHFSKQNQIQNDYCSSSRPLPTGKRTHVFLSHDWGEDENNHLRVKQINEALKNRGLVTWLDDDTGKEGESGIVTQIDRAIAAAIEDTACMIVFLTENYKNKVNSGDANEYCLKEFKYGMKCLGAEKMLLVVLDSSMKDTKKWNGSLGFSLADTLFLDLSTLSESQEMYDRLINALYDKLVIRLEQTQPGAKDKE